MIYAYFARLYGIILHTSEIVILSFPRTFFEKVSRQIQSYVTASDGGSYIVKHEESVHFYLIPCWACCSPDHSRRFVRNLFMTMETHCVEHAGRARVMFGRGDVCFCVF